MPTGQRARRAGVCTPVRVGRVSTRRLLLCGVEDVGTIDNQTAPVRFRSATAVGAEPSASPTKVDCKTRAGMIALGHARRKPYCRVCCRNGCKVGNERREDRLMLNRSTEYSTTFAMGTVGHFHAAAETESWATQSFHLPTIARLPLSSPPPLKTRATALMRHVVKVCCLFKNICRRTLGHDFPTEYSA